MLQQASVTGFVRTLLIILLIYYGIKILSRLFAPLLLKYIAKKAEQKFGDQFGQFQQRSQQQQQKKEGEVTIDKMPNAKSSNKDVGEYVDYEEID
ncbi:hypothetical protein CJ739_3348 [Mariniflexile rhizosphaerae]|uniref:DUF4834 family protein n=1 Tax=unclassified Mariniflexile TaxID=2643887 RepID=UPI000CCB1A15|nr:DUF4834 family protein [Mariniflexile sp. TRM1-10]AXP82410.1 hypothetical protein CJ739_3348 [Mariniflexile sp. TRM1-10]PLB17699.1 MAG: hypothetical protein TRG1_3474 [Flavobacteriaceae bacterium FS1-H7996/R]